MCNCCATSFNKAQKEREAKTTGNKKKKNNDKKINKLLLMSDISSSNAPGSAGHDNTEKKSNIKAHEELVSKSVF